MRYVDKVYHQRNMVALTLANAFKGSGWYYDAENMDSPSNRVIKINHPEGQMTFHVRNDFNLGDLPQIEPDWDGHTKNEKWARMEIACGIGDVKRKSKMRIVLDRIKAKLVKGEAI